MHMGSTQFVSDSQTQSSGFSRRTIELDKSTGSLQGGPDIIKLPSSSKINSDHPLGISPATRTQSQEIPHTGSPRDGNKTGTGPLQHTENISLIGSGGSLESIELGKRASEPGKSRTGLPQHTKLGERPLVIADRAGVQKVSSTQAIVDSGSPGDLGHSSEAVDDTSPQSRGPHASPDRTLDGRRAQSAKRTRAHPLGIKRTGSLQCIGTGPQKSSTNRSAPRSATRGQAEGRPLRDIKDTIHPHTRPFPCGRGTAQLAAQLAAQRAAHDAAHIRALTRPDLRRPHSPGSPHLPHLPHLPQVPRIRVTPAEDSSALMKKDDSDASKRPETPSRHLASRIDEHETGSRSSRLARTLPRRLPSQSGSTPSSRNSSFASSDVRRDESPLAARRRCFRRARTLPHIDVRDPTPRPPPPSPLDDLPLPHLRRRPNAKTLYVYLVRCCSLF